MALAADALRRDLEDARRRTLELIETLTDEQLRGGSHPIVNPLLWEVGHVGWFQERWASWHLRNDLPLREDAERLYNSSTVPFATRPFLPLPDRKGTLAYIRAVLDRVEDRLATRPVDENVVYFHRLATYHEDMHDEAFALTLQVHGWKPPAAWRAAETIGAGPLPGSVSVPGGPFRLGADPREEHAFVFDNEKWAHPVELAPFEIARAPVTNAEFAAFVDDGGYRRRELWSDAGWAWRQVARAEQPVYWRQEDGAWSWRRFDRVAPLAPHAPVCHVSWYEADAYARWAAKRLPTEAEWELAASGSEKRRFPWGDEPPAPDRANLDGERGGTIDVAALPAGDSVFGCRQMIGNIWEWTASDFVPYPGFVVDPYADYSKPWFGDHKVLRGGAWTARGRMLRNTWRNFYKPDRRDPFAGFRLAETR